jgi:hypothetical protein
MTAIFLFRSRHRDGSIIEFSDQVWTSDDPRKRRRLIQMSDLYSSSPALTPRVKVWLKNNCQLIDFAGPETASAKRPEKFDHQAALNGNE